MTWFTIKNAAIGDTGVTIGVDDVDGIRRDRTIWTTTAINDCCGWTTVKLIRDDGDVMSGSCIVTASGTQIEACWVGDDLEIRIS